MAINGKLVRKITFAVITVVSAYVISTAALAAAKQAFTFKFNPPDGTAYIITAKTTKVVAPGNGEKRTDVTITKEKSTIHKVDGGYTHLTEPISVIRTRDGKPVEGIESIIAQTAIKKPLTSKLKSDGTLIEIVGYDHLIKAIDEALKDFDPQKTAELQAFLKDGMKTKLFTEWNNKIVGFVGRRVEIGDKWTETSPLETPIGDIDTTITTTIKRIVPNGNRSDIELEFTYQCDPKSLQKVFNDLADSIAKSVSNPAMAPKVVGGDFTGTGTRVIDPSTMLIQSEKLQRNGKLLLSVPGIGNTTTTFSESRTYNYEYLK